MTGENTLALSQRSVKVLLISPANEDHQHLRDILRNSNWQSHEARTQKEAFEFLRDNTVSVAICESELPDGTWKDVLRRFNQIDCPPLLVVTARFADERLWSEVLNLGAYNVLAQPLRRSEVFHVVGMASRQWEEPARLAKSA